MYCDVLLSETDFQKVKLWGRDLDLCFSCWLDFEIWQIKWL